MPPDLLPDGPLTGFYNFYVPSGGSASFTITCLSTDSKAEFVNNWPFPIAEARYNIRITLHFDTTEDLSETLELERTVYLSNYDNC